MISVYAYHMCLNLFLLVQSLLTCFSSFLTHFVDFVSNNSSSDTKALYVSLHSQAPQQQYIAHCMHYSITLWAYLSEPFLKNGHKRRRESHNTMCSSHLITHYHYIRVTEKYTETLHVKKMADLVTVT